ncbi:hypothetical protein DVH05_000216 [Phytophthora capsici]|nr:hypothetical protein DVH05_000216 [Phytophthora capsici]|eukprot:jgi/Phyca11/130688/e_gw1.96.105.1
MTIQLRVRALLVLVCFAAICIHCTSSETHAYIRNAAPGYGAQVVYGDNSVRHLKGDRELIEGGTLLTNIENEERGVSLSSASKFFGRLKARINGNAGAKTEKLTGTQVKTVSREVAGVVRKDPKAWPVIKTSLKVLYGTVLFTLIAAGVYAVLRQMQNYM